MRCLPRNSEQTTDAPTLPGVAADPSVLALGPWSSGEFAETLRALPNSESWPVAATVDDALRQIAACEAPPEIGLVAVARPNEFKDEELLRLGQAAPLLRLVVVAGTWCEGELRTGSPPTGVARLYWHELPTWWNAALEAVRRDNAPPWSAPLPDRFAGPQFAVAPPTIDPPHRRLIVDARDYLVFETLATVLTPLAWTVQWQPRHRPQKWIDASAEIPTAGLFDGSQLDRAEVSALEQFCQRMATSGVAVVTLLDFPRREHVQQIRNAGATSLLGKPYRVEALRALLDEATLISHG